MVWDIGKPMAYPKKIEKKFGMEYRNFNMAAVMLAFIGRSPDFLTNISCVDLWFKQE
jgi:hypothetical protein